MTCPFCGDGLNILRENELAYAIYDKYPVSRGHILIIPKRHVSSYFDTTPEERPAMEALLDESKTLLAETHSPGGYNIRINVGQAAGQTIFHVPLHVTPRYEGDLDDLRGGVTGVIPEKRIY